MLIRLLVLACSLVVAFLIVAAALWVAGFLFRLGRKPAPPPPEVEETGTLPSILDYDAKGRPRSGPHT